MDGQQIVVVGGGIAGVTTTTAAILYGANVILLEATSITRLSAWLALLIVVGWLPVLVAYFTSN